MEYPGILGTSYEAYVGFQVCTCCPAPRDGRLLSRSTSARSLSENSNIYINDDSFVIVTYDITDCGRTQLEAATINAQVTTSTEAESS